MRSSEASSPRRQLSVTATLYSGNEREYKGWEQWLGQHLICMLLLHGSLYAHQRRQLANICARVQAKDESGIWLRDSFHVKSVLQS